MWHHFRGWYVQTSMELEPEDVSLLERCPHFRGYMCTYTSYLGDHRHAFLHRAYCRLEVVSHKPLEGRSLSPHSDTSTHHSLRKKNRYGLLLASNRQRESTVNLTPASLYFHKSPPPHHFLEPPWFTDYILSSPWKAYCTPNIGHSGLCGRVQCRSAFHTVVVYHIAGHIDELSPGGREGGRKEGEEGGGEEGR